ncbi:MAG: glycosyltransferase family 2 protein, partial [Halobaculum sp.]
MSGRVSVVMPYYDGAEYVGAALRSIDDQSYDDIEVIVVDDGSPTAAHEAVKSELATVSRPTSLRRHETNRGISAARNTGVEAASGAYVAVHDQDDVSRPKRFERQVALMEDRPAVGTCMTDVVHIDADGERRGRRSYARPLDTYTADDVVREMFERWIERGAALPITTELTRATVYETVGTYAGEYYGAQDHEFL